MRLRAKMYSVLSVDLKEKKKAFNVFKVGPYFTEFLFLWIYICLILRKPRFPQNII